MDGGDEKHGDEAQEVEEIQEEARLQGREGQTPHKGHRMGRGKAWAAVAKGDEVGVEVGVRGASEGLLRLLIMGLYPWPEDRLGR